MSLCLSNGTKRCLNCWHAAPAGWSCPIYSFPVSLLSSWWVWWTRRPRLRPASLTHSRSLSSPLRGRVQPLQSSRGPATRHSLRALGMNIFPKIRGKGVLIRKIDDNLQEKITWMANFISFIYAQNAFWSLQVDKIFPPPLAPAQPSPGSCHPLVRAQAKQWQTENQAFKAFKLVFYASEAYPRDLQYWIAKLVKNKPDTNKIMSSSWFLLWLISLVQWQMR